ncbi:hypothetical protein COCVIDRAFT_107051, partial [Bipolaris victoriae FI3]
QATRNNIEELCKGLMLKVIKSSAKLPMTESRPKRPGIGIKPAGWRQHLGSTCLSSAVQFPATFSFR